MNFSKRAGGYGGQVEQRMSKQEVNVVFQYFDIQNSLFGVLRFSPAWFYTRGVAPGDFSDLSSITH